MVMATIKLNVRGTALDYSPSHDSAMRLKEDLPQLISNSFPDSKVLPDASFELISGTSGLSLSDESAIMEESVIFVLEIFTTTPCSLFRTVQPHQIHPAILSVDQSNPWSRMNPLYCGSFLEDSEIDAQPKSPFHVDRKPAVTVCGMSLKSVVPSRERSSLLDEVLPDEELGWSILGDSSILGKEDGDFGILHDGTLVERGPVNNVRHNLVTIGNSNKRKGFAQKRMIFFTYELPAGTDLSCLGMAVVFDNADPAYPGHFTMIPWNLAVRRLRDDELALDNNKLTVSVTDVGQSFYRAIMIDRSIYCTFPLVAAQFKFHSMWMNASAACIIDDFDGQNDPDKLLLAEGVAVFYDHLEDLHQPEDVFPLLSKLFSSNYDIGLLSQREVHCLCRMFESLLGVGSIDNFENDTVQKSLEIVKRFFLDEQLIIFGTSMTTEKYTKAREEGGDENHALRLDPDYLRNALMLQEEYMDDFIEQSNCNGQEAWKYLRGPSYTMYQSAKGSMFPHCLDTCTQKAVSVQSGSMEITIQCSGNEADGVYAELRNEKAQKLLLAVANLHFPNQVPLLPALVEARQEIFEQAPFAASITIFKICSAVSDIYFLGQTTKSISQFLRRKDSCEWKSVVPCWLVNACKGGGEEISLSAVLPSLRVEPNDAVRKLSSAASAVVCENGHIKPGQGVHTIFALFASSAVAKQVGMHYVLRLMRRHNFEIQYEVVVDL